MSELDLAALIHPVIAITIVFPLLGMVVNYAWQTRQRRLQTKSEGKNKIAPTVGATHFKLGQWFSNAVVGLALIGLAYPLFTKMAKNQVWAQDAFRAWFVVAMFVVTIASLILLNQAKPKLWRGVFATLVGTGLVVLGCQPEIFRRGFEWYFSHYYYGIAAAFLMIFALATFQDIYQDRTQRWRQVHIVLNMLALLLFVGQGMTGTRDLLEIPLSWQEQYIQQLYINNCQTQPCEVKPAPTQPTAP